MKLKFLQKLFSPSREFSERAKERFLVAFDARYPSVVLARAPWFVFAMKASVGVIAVVAVLLGSASVYADTKNVPADNPLYPLKRFNETVQLAVAPAGNQAQLHAAFAARRVAELGDLEERKPASDAITQLKTDADESVNASITEAENNDIHDGALSDLCGRLLLTIATSSVGQSVAEFSGHKGDLERFTNKCEKADSDRDENITTSTADISTTTVDASASATTSTTPNLEFRIRKFLDRRPSRDINMRGDGQKTDEKAMIYSNQGLGGGDGKSKAEDVQAD